MEDQKAKAEHHQPKRDIVASLEIRQLRDEPMSMSQYEADRNQPQARLNEQSQPEQEG